MKYDPLTTLDIIAKELCAKILQINAGLSRFLFVDYDYD